MNSPEAPSIKEEEIPSFTGAASQIANVPPSTPVALPRTPQVSSTTARLSNVESARLSRYEATDLYAQMRDKEKTQSEQYMREQSLRKEDAAWRDTEEIRAQAAPALSELSKLNPSSPTYLQDRDALATRYPMALLDGSFKSVDKGKEDMYKELTAERTKSEDRGFARETQQIGNEMDRGEIKYRSDLGREDASDGLKTQITGLLMKLSPQAREQHQQLVKGGMDQRDALLKVEADNKDYIASTDAKEARAGMNKSQAQVAKANAEIAKIQADPMLSGDEPTKAALLQPHLDAIAEARDSYDFDKHILDTYMTQRGIAKPKKETSPASNNTAPLVAPLVAPVRSLIPKNRSWGDTAPENTPPSSKQLETL